MKKDVDYVYLNSGSTVGINSGDKNKDKKKGRNTSTAKEPPHQTDIDKATDKAQASLEKALSEASDKVTQLETTLKTRSQMVTSKNSKITDLKNQLKNSNDELKNSNDELKQIKMKIVDLEKEVKQLKKINEDNKKKTEENVTNVKESHEREKLITEQLDAERVKMRNQEKINKEINRKMETTEKEMSQTLQENIEMYDRLEKKDEDIQEKNEELQKVKKQLERKNKEYEDLMMKYIKSQEQNHQQKDHGSDKPSAAATQKTALLMADSNGKRIYPKLTRNDGVQWQHVRDVYRAADIPIQLEDNEIKQQLNKANSITIMVGLNEIRDGKNATEAYTSIEENTLPIIATNKPVIICEIPPVANNISHKIEAECLNVLLKKIPRKYPNVTILESWKELDSYDPLEIFEEKDLFHLDKDKEGTTIMAQKIMDLTKKVHKDIPAKEIITEKITIMKDTAQHYIGTKGKNLKKLTNDHQVNIAIPRDSNELIILTGTQENVNSASQEIMAMKESLNNQPQQQHSYKTKPCMYYMRDGYFKKGDNCTYRHDAPNRSRSRSNIREERSSENETQRDQTKYHSQTEKTRETRRTEPRQEDRSRPDRRQHHEQRESRHQSRHYQSQNDRRRKSRSNDRQRHTSEERRPRSPGRYRATQNNRNEKTRTTYGQTGRSSSRSEHFYSH